MAEPPVGLVGREERVATLFVGFTVGRGLTGSGAAALVGFTTGGGKSGTSGSGVMSAVSGISGGVGKVSSGARGTELSSAEPVVPASVS
ncbi:MAG: hypothetical protein HC845_11185 [Akkermansiaceae bacterium]|nr:hypothetical protein [Akkermansiaceae bacterium]